MSREIIVFNFDSPVLQTPSDIPDAVHDIDVPHRAVRAVTDE